MKLKQIAIPKYIPIIWQNFQLIGINWNENEQFFSGCFIIRKS